MTLPMMRSPYDMLPAKFRHLESDVELRMQTFVVVRDAQERVLLMRIEGVDGWCLQGETMRVNESPDQAAVRAARSWFSTPVGMALERVLSFPATSAEDNKWYVIFVYGAEGPADLKGTPDTLETRFFPLDAGPADLAFSHRDVWSALRSG